MSLISVRWYEEGYNDVPCVLPWGACCLEDGTCDMSPNESVCFYFGGYFFLGPGIDCSPNPCPQPGACCLAGGYCLEWIEVDCMMIGGEFMGEEIPCDPDPCVTSSVPEISTETVTWRRIKSTYRE